MSLHYRDLTGQKFGRLTVVKDAGYSTEQNYRVWQCVCECGNVVEVPSSRLNGGGTKSCGCLRREVSKRNGHITGSQYATGITRNELKEGTGLCFLTQRVGSNNSSGVKGVRYIKTVGKWLAEITIRGNRMYLGKFDTIEEAADARRRAELKYFEPILNRYGRTLKEG